MYQPSSRASVAQLSEPDAAAQRQPERRKIDVAADSAALRTGLTAQQVSTLDTLEQFHWRLQFVRRPLFKSPIPVLVERCDTRLVVIEEDGTINENPGLRLRG